MQPTIKLEQGKYYHIYNCGIDGVDIFKVPADYNRFLGLYEKYIEPVCETYAWVLMKNHFHFFVKIREGVIYKHAINDGSISIEQFNVARWETVENKPDNSIDLSGLNVSYANPVRYSPGFDIEANIEQVKIPKPHLHFSHLFNSYAKYFNIRYSRHGSLFERQFKRKEVMNQRYFRSLVLYIHQNPVHHGFCDHPLDYGWSSYLTCISIRPTKLKRNEVIGWFDSVGDFKYRHGKNLKTARIEEWLRL